MMVMMMAMTPSLNASSRLVFTIHALDAPRSVMLPFTADRSAFRREWDIRMRKAYLTLLAASALACVHVLCASAAAPLPPDVDRQLARDMLKRLVEINTTHAHGSTGAAKAIQSWLLSAGFPPADVVLLAPPDHPTKGSVVVRYRGRHSAHPVLFLGHLDVVEAKPEDWSVDPFKLTEQDGWFYGRGTIDMKDGDAAMVESLVRLKREQFVPDRDLIVAFTADEEAGGDANGPAFLLKEHRDLIDADLVINLDGGGGNYQERRAPVTSRSAPAKRPTSPSRCETTSPGGHGSLPGSRTMPSIVWRPASAAWKPSSFRSRSRRRRGRVSRSSPTSSPDPPAPTCARWRNRRPISPRRSV